MRKWHKQVLLILKNPTLLTTEWSSSIYDAVFVLKTWAYLWQSMQLWKQTRCTNHLEQQTSHYNIVRVLNPLKISFNKIKSNFLSIPWIRIILKIPIWFLLNWCIRASCLPTIKKFWMYFWVSKTLLFIAFVICETKQK